ncbi:MAG: hypothetical protein F9K24_22700 [Leptonema illini]|uniref:Uncharacterized protein n=1 Tax=Leptonema illini TaxID=183 RepID=A0A833LTX3_9LEPT|nr:MAG: hypothetical protein F9K24_22700 [Leptonema illini]
MAIFYAGEEFIYLSPDGTRIQVRGWGDQFQPTFETLDGYTVVKDPKSGYLHYAVLSPDQTALLPSGLRVGEIPAQHLPFPRHLRALSRDLFPTPAPFGEDLALPSSG